MKLKPKILTYKENIREVEYPWYLEVLKYTWQSPWTYTEVAMTGDIQDWKEITEREREVIAGILRGFTLIENHIGCYWRDIVAKTFGHPEIRDLAVTFSHTEGIHRRAYDHLEATLGFNTYEAFLADPITRKKLDYFINNLESPSDLGRSLALFSAAGEGVSLFSSFGVLLAFSQDSRFKGMWQIISWSAQEELTHSKTGIQLYKDLISEDSAYKFKDSEVYEGFEAIVQNEINYINQIFSDGDLSYVTRSETEDYIKYRANLKLMELYLKPIYELSGEYRRMNHYFKTALEGKTLNDFFAQQRNGGAYTAKLTQDFRSCIIK